MFPTEGDVQGDRRDDPHGGQERGREDQLQRVQGDDGGAPTHHPRSPGLQVWTPHLSFTTTHHYQMRSIFNEIHFLIVSFINICRELTLFVKIYQGQLHYQF